MGNIKLGKSLSQTGIGFRCLHFNNLTGDFSKSKDTLKYVNIISVEANNILLCNQLVPDPEFINNSTWGGENITISGGIATGHVPPGSYQTLTYSPMLQTRERKSNIVGHKYLVVFDYLLNSNNWTGVSELFISDYNEITDLIVDDKWHTYSKILTGKGNNNHTFKLLPYLKGNFTATEETYFKVKSVYLIDLTLWFSDNIPSSVIDASSFASTLGYNNFNDIPINLLEYSRKTIMGSQLIEIQAYDNNNRHRLDFHSILYSTFPLGLLKLNGISDEFGNTIENGTQTGYILKNIGVRNAVSEDENNPEVVTDGINTIYKLDKPLRLVLGSPIKLNIKLEDGYKISGYYGDNKAPALITLDKDLELETENIFIST